MLVQWMREDANFTASTLAHRMKCEDQGCEKMTCSYVDAAPEPQISTYTGGSVKHPQSIFSEGTFGLFLLDCDSLKIIFALAVMLRFVILPSV